MGRGDDTGVLTPRIHELGPVHDVGAPAACRRVWCVLRTTCRSQSADNVESRGPVGEEAEPLWGARRARVPRLQEPGSG
jgi:hypothetical protein